MDHLNITHHNWLHRNNASDEVEHAGVSAQPATTSANPAPAMDQPPFFPHPAIINARAAINELEGFLSIQSFLAQQSQRNLNRSVEDYVELQVENSGLQARIKELEARVASQDSETTELKDGSTQQAFEAIDLSDDTTPKNATIKSQAAEISKLTEEGHQKDRLVRALQRTLIMNVIRSRDVEMTKLREKHRHHATEIIDLRRRDTSNQKRIACLNWRITHLESTISTSLSLESSLRLQLSTLQAQASRLRSAVTAQLEELIRSFTELCDSPIKHGRNGEYIMLEVQNLREQVGRMRADLEEERRLQARWL